MIKQTQTGGDTKVCSRCGEAKPLDRFGNSKRTSDGKLCHCKDCAALEMQEWRKQNPSKVRANNRKHRYGITTVEFDRRLHEQGHCCAICSTPVDEETACVDHCHTTGAVRGLLCSPCNKGLGHFMDDTSRLSKAIEYLER